MPSCAWPRPDRMNSRDYKDDRKAGGRFESITGNLKKIDLYQGGLILTDGREIPFFCICDLELAE